MITLKSYISNMLFAYRFARLPINVYVEDTPYMTIDKGHVEHHVDYWDEDDLEMMRHDYVVNDDIDITDDEILIYVWLEGEYDDEEEDKE